MLKLSLDSTNSINICQEEIYHLTTAGNNVLLSVFLPPLCYPSFSVFGGWHRNSKCWSIFIKCHCRVNENMISFQYLHICFACRQLFFWMDPDIVYCLITKKKNVISLMNLKKEKSAGQPNIYGLFLKNVIFIHTAVFCVRLSAMLQSSSTKIDILLLASSEKTHFIRQEVWRFSCFSL